MILFLFIGLMGGEAQAVIEKPAILGSELGMILQQLQVSQGIRFKVPDSLVHDTVKISPFTGKDPELAKILKGYNWMGVRDVTGAWISVHITGRNGDGVSSFRGIEASVPLSYRAPPKTTPDKYKGFPKGSVYPIDISSAMLRRMSLGEQVVLTLPSGDHALIHDHTWDHANGDRTWVGKSLTEKGLYRSIITLGDQDQIDGQIVTPEGAYLLESDVNGQWLIDLKASGLQPGSFDQGGIPPVTSAVATLTMASAGAVTPPSTQAPGFTARASTAKMTEIDLLLLYQDDLTASNPLTRLNSLVAFANQAMVDSKVDLQFNLLAAKAVNYSHAASNVMALNQLTAFQPPFNNVSQQREKLGADVVLLIRSFQPSAEDSSCGDAWINGGSGSGFSPDLAFGVVNDGRSGGLYCSQYTLAHELGHLLGAAHDRSHAISAGHFTYSYGYGKPGVFGDIMSYYSPEVGLFANPDLSECLGQRCGIAIGQVNEADVVSTFKESGPIVAKFLSGAAH